MFHALCMGNCIAQQLIADQNLKLIGQTSRGCFLQTASAPVWTVFLSEESSHGPLTINLPSGAIPSIKTAVGPVIPLRQGILNFFPTVSLSLQDVPLWQPSSPIKSILPVSIRTATITRTIQAILQQKAASGLTGILPDLLPLLDLPTPAPASNGPFTDKLNALIHYLKTPEATSLASHLVAFLGQGSGLTPSGDDFLMGYFLTLHRWGNPLSMVLKTHSIDREIIPAAREKTTHLSANLIECAIHGQADQRLINALDGLMTTEKCDQAWLDGLLTWGNSSGLDAFAGMVLASVSP